MWFDLAGAHGHVRAAKIRDRLAKGMTPEQIAEAKELAVEWKPSSE